MQPMRRAVLPAVELHTSILKGMWTVRKQDELLTGEYSVFTPVLASCNQLPQADPHNARKIDEWKQQPAQKCADQAQSKLQVDERQQSRPVRGFKGGFDV